MDRFTETITAFVRFQALGDLVDDFVPGSGHCFFIDAAIREHDRPVFQKAGEDQDSRMHFRVMKAVAGKGHQAGRIGGLLKLGIVEWKRSVETIRQNTEAVARPEGFEPPTPRSVVWCSVQLSYGRSVNLRSQII